jgi:hypothetical protein
LVLLIHLNKPFLSTIEIYSENEISKNLAEFVGGVVGCHLGTRR